MYQHTHITTLTNELPVMQGDMEMLNQVIRTVPGSVKYSIRRYKKPLHWMIEDKANLQYHFVKDNPSENSLELHFCASGNVYCRQKQTECNFCTLNPSQSCVEKVDSVDMLSFSFSAAYLNQFAKAQNNPESLSDNVLAFKHPDSFSKIMPICSKTGLAIEALLNHTYSDSRENIFINAQTQILLLYSLDCMLGEKTEQPFTCKFLSNEEDKEKILKAREILLQHIGEPITIKALSRKVAINECYLKKGFKEIFGTTIFDFYQGQRMEHAKYLLYEKGLSVTEVSLSLGYSSISHFSTAFKKHTGLKPCELLLR